MLKQTHLPHQLLSSLLPFEEEAFSHTCLMRAACHSQSGFYSPKSPLHTHWAFLSTLHFKNLGSFRGNKDSVFFPLYCDEHLFSLQDALKHLENSHHGFWDMGALRGIGMWSADPGLEHKEALRSTGHEHTLLASLAWLTQPSPVNESSWGYRKGENIGEEPQMVVLSSASVSNPPSAIPSSSHQDCQGPLLADSILPQSLRSSGPNRKDNFPVLSPDSFLPLHPCTHPKTHTFSSLVGRLT